MSARWELIRALGAVAGDPADARAVLRALGLEPCDGASHAEAFVLNCPPYASVYLGAEGGLGGDAADRVAGFWRAIGLTPAEPDHLTSVFGLYARLGEAGLGHARSALFWEHVWPWVPGYLAAVADLGIGPLSAWAELTRQMLEAERDSLPPGTLPLALREAPPALGGDENLGELLDALVTPVRSGIVLTRRALAAGADQAGAGHRIGERRFTLRAMLEQEPERTLAWLTAEADRWSALHSGPGRHAGPAPGDPVRQWWVTRARATAAALHRATSGCEPGR